MTTPNNQTYTATCKRCGAPVITNNGGQGWRHVEAPETKHRAWATGTMVQR